MIYTIETINKLADEWLNSDSEKSKRAWKKILKQVKYES